MATTLKVVAGNTAPSISITCQRDDGSVINLTGCTVQLIIKGTTITQAGRSATITTAASGIISYAPLATDFPTAGKYVADVKVTYGDATIEILYQQLKVKARAKIA